MDTQPGGLGERAAHAIERQDRLRAIENARPRAITAA